MRGLSSLLLFGRQTGLSELIFSLQYLLVLEGANGERKLVALVGILRAESQMAGVAGLSDAVAIVILIIIRTVVVCAEIAAGLTLLGRIGLELLAPVALVRRLVFVVRITHIQP